MTPRAPHVCSADDCVQLVPAGGGSRCDEHRLQRSSRTGTWGTQRTATPEWRALRKQILDRDKTCRHRTERCTVAATEVDHVMPHAAGGSDDPINLVGSCGPCHRLKTAREARWWQHQQGPPPWPDDPALKVKGPPAPPVAAWRGKRRPGQPITFATAPRPIIMRGGW